MANAIASLVEDSQLKENYIIPKVNDPRILPVVTQTLKDAILRHIKKDSRSLTAINIFEILYI